MFVSPSLSGPLSRCLFFFVYLCMSFSLYMFLSISLVSSLPVFVCLCLALSVSFSLTLSLSLSVCLCLSLSLCLPIYMLLVCQTLSPSCQSLFLLSVTAIYLVRTASGPSLPCPHFNPI